jgi:hypothetical protein
VIDGRAVDGVEPVDGAVGQAPERLETGVVITGPLRIAVRYA